MGERTIHTPYKKQKNQKLSEGEKQYNIAFSSQVRILVENAIGKDFNIIKFIRKNKQISHFEARLEGKPRFPRILVQNNSSLGCS